MAFSFENLKANLSNMAKKTGEVAEKAVKKGSEVAEMAVKKGTEVAGIAKLNISLKEKEGELKKRFTELGELCYNKAEDSALAAKIVDIDDVKAAIEALKNEIAEANGKTICSCGKEIDIDASFCKYCGAKIEKKADDVKPEPEDVKPAEADGSDEVKDAKPLTTDEFVDTFESVMDKYDLNKK
ncbi:MAG: hypothetical protein ACI4T6_06225 [Candidatus Flemingiibacterium sp.]